MFGITIEKLFVILVFAALVIGPSRLPGYAQRVADLIRGMRGLLRTARAHAENDLGVPIDRDRWRQLDPRTAIRDALAEPQPAEPQMAAAPAAAAAPTAPTARYVVTGSSAHPRRTLVAPRAETATVAGTDDSNRSSERATAPRQHGDPSGDAPRDTGGWES